MPTAAQKMLANVRALRAQGAPKSVIDAEVERWKPQIANENASEKEQAGQIDNLTKAATVAGEFANGATFGLGGLAADAIAAAIDPNLKFSDVREMRADREKQTGWYGGLANLAGGFLTGGASLNAIKNAATLGRIGKVALAAGDAAAQGGVSGAAEGLRDWSAQGLANAGRAGATGAVAGALFGSTLGAGAGALAARRAAKNIGKELVSRGVNIGEAEVIAKQLAEASPADIQAALNRVNDFAKAGRAGDVMAADVLGEEGGRLVRSAVNVSPKAGEVAKARIRDRDARIVGRTRADLGATTGFTPQEMDTFENAVLDARNKQANVSYGKTRSEGAAWDDLPNQIEVYQPPTVAGGGYGGEVNPSTREALDAFRTRSGQAATRKEGTVMQQQARESLDRHLAENVVSPSLTGQPQPHVVNPEVIPDNWSSVMRNVEDATADPHVQLELRAMAAKDPDKWASINPNSFDAHLEAYQRINKRLRAIEGNPNIDRSELSGLLTAKDKLGRSLEQRSDTFRPANADYFDASKGLEAYKIGQEASQQSLPSDARRLMADVRPQDQRIADKGFVDRMAEQAGAGPNPSMAEAARANQRIGQQVGTVNAATKFRDRFGPEALAALEDRARKEAAFARTSNFLQGNSTTTQQANGVANLLGLTTDVASGFSLNPAWWATMTGRRIAGDEMNMIAKKIAAQKAGVISEALTREGDQNVRQVLEGVLAEMNRRAAARNIGIAARQRARSVFARSAGQNDD